MIDWQQFKCNLWEWNFVYLSKGDWSLNDEPQNSEEKIVTPEAIEYVCLGVFQCQALWI